MDTFVTTVKATPSAEAITLPELTLWDRTQLIRLLTISNARGITRTFFWLAAVAWRRSVLLISPSPSQHFASEPPKRSSYNSTKTLSLTSNQPLGGDMPTLQITTIPELHH